MGVLNCSHVTLATQLDRVDTVIVDPPFSPRVSRGVKVRRRRDGATGVSLDGLAYDAWTPEDAQRLVVTWSPLTARWFVVLCSHDQIPVYEDALRAAGRYVFAPVPCVTRGMTVRMAGDGPSSWSTYAVCARPRGMRPLSGTLPGAYVGSRERLHVSGGKPLWLMDALVRDYSRPGDVVCDPCAGSGTTLVAALRAGRGVVGADLNPGRAALANQRLAEVLTSQQPPDRRVSRQR